ncbi:hypothetical protein Hanom_Chr15g01397501 [Helianthus anomalus]
MDREDKPVYMEDDRSKIWNLLVLLFSLFVNNMNLLLFFAFVVVSLYVVAYKREKGKMTTISKGAGEELWFQQIIRNFALPRDEDLAAQPSTGAGELTNLGIGPEKKKKRVLAVTIAPKKTEAPKAKSSKAKNVREEKKGTRLFLNPRCDYVLVSDTIEGLAPVVVKKLKSEPRVTSDIPASNLDEPIDLDSSSELLLRTKAVKQKEVEAAAQPAKKPKRKTGKRGNLDAFVSKLYPEKPIPSACAESSSVFNDDLPPTSPHTSIREQLEGTKAVETEAEKIVEAKQPEGEAEKPDVVVEKTIEVKLEAEKIVGTEVVDVGVTQPKSPEVVARESVKEKSIQEDPIIIIPFSATTHAPVHVEKSHPPMMRKLWMLIRDFLLMMRKTPIRPEETLGDYYYYRSYSEKRASNIHAPVWKLKQGDTFSDLQVCRDWLQGVLPPAEVKFQEERSHDQTYYAYLE